MLQPKSTRPIDAEVTIAVVVNTSCHLELYSLPMHEVWRFGTLQWSGGPLMSERHWQIHPSPLPWWYLKAFNSD